LLINLIEKETLNPTQNSSPIPSIHPLHSPTTLSTLHYDDINIKSEPMNFRKRNFTGSCINTGRWWKWREIKL